MADDEDRALVETLAAHLEATGELPIERQANRWLGEAAAVAADATADDLSDEVRADRVNTVLELLDEVAETGHQEADEHVAAARRAAERYLERSPE